MKTKPIYVFIGRFTPERMLAGEIRVLNVTRSIQAAVSQLAPNARFVKIDKVYSFRQLLVYFVSHPGVTITMLMPWNQVNFVSYHFLSPKVLRALRRLGRLRFYDFDDDPSRLLREYNMKHTPEEYDLLERLREETFRAYETILFTGHMYAEDYPQLSDNKKLVVPNGSDPDHIRYSGPITRNVVGMVGGTSPGRGIIELVEACKIVKQKVPDLELLLALDSVENRGNLPEIMKFIYNTEWIHTTSVDYADVSDFLSKLKIGLIPYRDLPLMNIVMPLKLFDYMAAGKPIVATKLRQVAEVLEDAKGGIATGFSAEEIADGLYQLLALPQNKLQTYGKAGRAAVEHKYAWSYNTQVIKSFLERTGV